jgi:6-phosphofructo-2-kinase / fructose-2,6-biphosphatase 4
MAVPGLDPLTVPGSPEDIRIPVPDSGIDTPANFPTGGLSSPADLSAVSFDKPPEKVVHTPAETVTDKIADED